MSAGNVIGVTLAKINGIYDLEVTDASWDTKRAVPQHHTGGGIRNAVGLPAPSITFSKVIPKDTTPDVFALSQFSFELFDKETRKIVVASFTGCDWNSIGGSTNVAQAMTNKKVAINATGVVKP